MSTGAKLLLTCMILEGCHLKLKVVLLRLHQSIRPEASEMQAAGEG